jgi:hypothetical protein
VIDSGTDTQAETFEGIVMVDIYTLELQLHWCFRNDEWKMTVKNSSHFVF